MIQTITTNNIDYDHMDFINSIKNKLDNFKKFNKNNLDYIALISENCQIGLIPLFYRSYLKQVCMDSDLEPILLLADSLFFENILIKEALNSTYFYKSLNEEVDLNNLISDFYSLNLCRNDSEKVKDLFASEIDKEVEINYNRVVFILEDLQNYSGNSIFRQKLSIPNNSISISDRNLIFYSVRFSIAVFLLGFSKIILRNKKRKLNSFIYYCKLRNLVKRFDLYKSYQGFESTKIPITYKEKNFFVYKKKQRFHNLIDMINYQINKSKWNNCKTKII